MACFGRRCVADSPDLGPPAEDVGLKIVEAGNRGSSGVVHALYSLCFLGRRGANVHVGYGWWRLGDLSPRQMDSNDAKPKPKQLKHLGLTHLN